MADRILSVRLYAFVAAALLVLLGLTTWFAYVDFGPFNLPVALLIAGTKATLVLLFFMHVRYEERLIWVFAGIGFFFLAILIGLSLADVLTRSGSNPFPW